LQQKTAIILLLLGMENVCKVYITEGVEQSGICSCILVWIEAVCVHV